MQVPDLTSGRKEWFGLLSDQAQECDFIFLDPDNGLEVKSIRYGRKNSSKYLYFREIEALWAVGKSLLIYQHFVREKRVDFVQRKLETLQRATPGSLVGAFSTAHVVFLLALQPEHHHFHAAIVGDTQDKWEGQIQHRELNLIQQSPPGAERLNRQFAGTNLIEKTESCPFCHLNEARIFFSSELVKGIWDSYPLNPGHALLIPDRHIARWFDATAQEQEALTATIERARAAIEDRYSPQGFNIGFNDQKAGGQTVPHLHIHVIPRYEGDVPDPRGGIRTIIPARAAYWDERE